MQCKIRYIVATHSTSSSCSRLGSVVHGLRCLGSQVWSTGVRVGCMGRATNSSSSLSLSAEGRWMLIAICRIRVSHTPTLGPRGILIGKRQADNVTFIKVSYYGYNSRYLQYFTQAHLNPSKVDVLKEERDILVRQVFQYEGLFPA